MYWSISLHNLSALNKRRVRFFFEQFPINSWYNLREQKVLQLSRQKAALIKTFHLTAMIDSTIALSCNKTRQNSRHPQNNRSPCLLSLPCFHYSIRIFCKGRLIFQNQFFVGRKKENRKPRWWFSCRTWESTISSVIIGLPWHRSTNSG